MSTTATSLSAIPTGNRRVRIIPTIHGLCYRLVMSATMMAAAMLSFPTVTPVTSSDYWDDGACLVYPSGDVFDGYYNGGYHIVTGSYGRIDRRAWIGSIMPV